MQEDPQPRHLHVQLRRLLAQGPLLRVRPLPSQVEAASRVLLPSRCRADLRPLVRALRQAGDGRKGMTSDNPMAAVAKKAADPGACGSRACAARQRLARRRRSRSNRLCHRSGVARYGPSLLLFQALDEPLERRAHFAHLVAEVSDLLVQPAHLLFQTFDGLGYRGTRIP